MKPLFVTWAKMPEVVGGCESIFQDLSDNLNGELVTYPFGNRVFRVEGMPDTLRYIEEYKSWMFDDVLSRMLKDMPNSPIIANCGTINIWKKHNTRIINIFNDPYKIAQNTMLKHRSQLLYYPHIIEKLTELQIKSAEGAINVTVSKVAKKGMEEIGIECDGIIEHGVDDKLFKPMDKYELREKYGIEGKKIGLFVGLVHPIKNWHAMEYLIENRRDITWILIFKKALQTFENPTYYFNTHIYYTLLREQMVEMYNMADFVIIPSYFESFGLVAVEAGLCGIPVISSRVGWIEDKGVTDYGIVVDSFNPKYFSKAIDKLFQYSFNPRPYMKKRFSFKKWIERWRKLIHSKA